MGRNYASRSARSARRAIHSASGCPGRPAVLEEDVEAQDRAEDEEDTELDDLEEVLRAAGSWRKSTAAAVSGTRQRYLEGA
jgi:hypothetical protein